MFLRQYHRTKNGTRHTYFALVEAQRTERGPRQRIVAQLGELTRDQQRCRRRTAIFHTRHKDGGELPLFVDEGSASLPDDPHVVRIHLGKVGWTNARAFGDVGLGFPLYPCPEPRRDEAFAGNTNDATAFPTIVETMEKRFGTARRVGVLDRGIASQTNVAFLKELRQSFLVGTPRSQLSEFEAELCTKDWQTIRPAVEVQTVQREGQTYVLA